MKPSKNLIILVLFVHLSFMLSGCVVVLNNNWGSNIRVAKSHDLSDAKIIKEFESSLDIKKGR